MVADTAKTHKNRSANLYNRFLFCNTFLLPVLYLHRYFLQQTLATLFERAVRCIKFYEDWHDIKRNYPYIGWGHCVQPHENFKKNLTLEQADSLLRSDLRAFCGMFRKYGKDSLLLAVLAYNVGPYKVLGDRRKFRKSRLLQKIERGERDIEMEYLDFCRWKGKVIASIRRRRNTELRLLYEP